MVFKKIFKVLQKIFRAPPRRRKNRRKKSSLPQVTRKKVKPSKSPAVKTVLVGEITHYFSKISVCVVKVTRQTLTVGDQIKIQGKATNFIQKVHSLQIESVDVRSAKKGRLAGLKVEQIAKPGDKVYKVLSH